MSVGIIAIGLIIFVFTVFALYDILFKDTKCETFQSACISCCCGMGVLLIIFGVIWYSIGQMDTEPLYGHIDHSKTKTIKENGEVTDLYLTIDGKEYHFEFEEQGVRIKMNARCDNIFTIEYVNYLCKDVCSVCGCKNICFLAFLNLDLDFVMLYSEGEVI